MELQLTFRKNGAYLRILFALAFQMQGATRRTEKSEESGRETRVKTDGFSARRAGGRGFKEKAAVSDIGYS